MSDFSQAWRVPRPAEDTDDWFSEKKDPAKESSASSGSANPHDAFLDFNVEIDCFTAVSPESCDGGATAGGAEGSDGSDSSIAQRRSAESFIDNPPSLPLAVTKS